MVSNLVISLRVINYIMLDSCIYEHPQRWASRVAIRIARSIGLQRSLEAHTNPQEREFVSKAHSLRNCARWACYCFVLELQLRGPKNACIAELSAVVVAAANRLSPPLRR